MTVGFRLETGELALIWTTTPWTVPSNIGMAVNPDIDYVVVESDVTGSTERYVIAEAGWRPTARSSAATTLTPSRPRRPAAHRRRPRRPYLHAAVLLLPGHRHAHVVLAADFVTTEDGTGIVHIAPASVRRTSDPRRRTASSRSCRSALTVPSPSP